MDPVERLKGLGLTQYEASVYVHLLSGGAEEARTIAREANVPSGRIYDALHALADRGAVEVIPGRPKRFVAVGPQVALSELLQAKRVEMDRTFDELAREAARLEAELGPRTQSESRPVFNVSLGEETGHAFLATQVARASERIEASLRFDVRLQPRDVEVFRALAGAVERGVAVRAVLPASDLELAMESPLAEEVLDLLGPLLGDRLDVRIAEKAMVPFTVIDRESVTLAVKNPLDPDRYFAFLFVHDPPFALNLSNKFAELWEGAETGVGEALAGAELAAVEFEP